MAASTSEPGDRRPIAARETKLAARVAAWLVRRGASANGISLAGMGCGLAAGLALAGTWWWPDAARPLWLLGGVLVQARLIANLLDGMVAIGGGTASPVGELYNEVPDRVSDTAILLGLGIAAGGHLALGLAAALAAMATAYIRLAGRSAGAPSDFGGPMAKQHRMALATAVAAWGVVAPAGWAPPVAFWALVALTGLALLTAVLRLKRAAARLRGRAA